MRPLAIGTMVVLLSLLPHATSVAADEPPPFRVIVNPKNSATHLQRAFLRDAFFKKVRRWPNDQVIRPVDLKATAETRHKFSAELLARSVGAVRAYWQQRIFSGSDVPPPEVPSDDQVVRFVLEHDGAVGYVSGSADLRGAKVVAVSNK